MSDHVPVGEVTITLSIAPDGDLIVGTEWDEDIPFVNLLGMVEIAKDTILRSVPDQDDNGTPEDETPA